MVVSGGHVITGGTRSEVHLMIRDVVAVLLQASVAIHVLVCVREQPLLVIAPFVPLIGFGVTGLQLSVATAVPRAASICGPVGLQPRSELFGTDPVDVSTGGVTSEVQKMMRDADAEFPQASVAIHVQVLERPHPFSVIKLQI